MNYHLSVHAGGFNHVCIVWIIVRESAHFRTRANATLIFAQRHLDSKSASYLAFQVLQLTTSRISHLTIERA